MRLSFTKLDLYEFCPFAYRYRYVERVPVPFSPRLAVGAIVHAVLRGFLERLRDGLTAGRDELMQLYADYWTAAPRLTPEAYPDIWRTGHDLLTGYWDANHRALGQPVLLEARFRTRLRETDGHTVEGVVDRVDALDSGAEIIDYKSGRAPASLTDRHRTQLHTYALAVERSFGLEPRRLTTYFLRDNRGLSEAPDSGYANQVETRFAAAGAGIASGELLPTAGPHCARCDYRQRCPHRWTGA